MSILLPVNFLSVLMLGSRSFVISECSLKLTLMLQKGSHSQTLENVVESSFVSVLDIKS